jgi:hypothetical protein
MISCWHLDSDGPSKFSTFKAKCEGNRFFLVDLHCCDKASKTQCKDSCRQMLRIKTTGQELIDSLQEGGCGPPLPHVSFTFSSHQLMV